MGARGPIGGSELTQAAGWTALLALCFVPFVGCLDGTSDPAVTTPADAARDVDAGTEWVRLLTDAAGDATELNSDYVDGLVPCTRLQPAPDAPNPCLFGFDVENAQEQQGGIPAHPSHDVLGLAWRETPTTLDLRLEIATLDESLEGAMGEQPGDGVTYDVWWTDPETGCAVDVMYVVMRGSDEPVQFAWLAVFCWGTPMTEGPTGACHAVECMWHVDAEVSFGTPAAIEFHVPRRLLPQHEAGETIEGVHIAARGFYGQDGSRARTFVDGPVTIMGHGFGGEFTYDHDRSDPQAPATMTFALPFVDEGPPASPGRWTDDDPPLDGQVESPELDVLGYTFEQTPERFVVSVDVAEVSTSPDGPTISMSFHQPALSSYIGVTGSDGAWVPWSAGFDGSDAPPTSPTVQVFVEPGSPGRVTFQVERSSFPPVGEGELLQALVVGSSLETWTEFAAGAGVAATQATWRLMDLVDPAPALALVPSDPHLTAVAQRLVDATGDVDAPPDLTVSPRLYDIVAAGVTSTEPESLQFTLSIADLSQLAPPDGYDAVFYGLGVEHARGTTMVGHYRSLERPGGEFLCAPDATVLAAEPADPAQTTWTSIAGRILESGSSSGIGGGGSTGAAALVLFATRDCFDQPEGQDSLEISALKAGTYLVRRPLVRTAAGDQVHELDTVGSDEPLVVAFAPPRVVRPGFWSQPFGVENFWDIAGIVVAILTVAVTAAIFYRRRRVFHGYVDEVRRIQEDYRHDPGARATALVELRRRLHADLEAHRISDSHYPIVLERLRTRLTSARLTSLGHSFYDVPARISLRIERLLDDGYLAESEAEVLVPAIEQADMNAETKGRLLERLASWVREDHDETAT